MLSRVQKIRQALMHRPFNEQSAEYLLFLQKTGTQIRQLALQVETMDWSRELEELDKRIDAISRGKV